MTSNIIIIKSAEGQIMSVNRTIDGCCLEVIGLDIVTIGGLDADHEILRKSLDNSAIVTAEDSDGVKYTVERHFLGS